VLNRHDAQMSQGQAAEEAAELVEGQHRFRPKGQRSSGRADPHQREPEKASNSAKIGSVAFGDISRDWWRSR
jgi:hypothetical protein